MTQRRRLPAEWEPQSGVMLTWPHADGDWGTSLDRVEAVFVQLAVAISRREKVLLVCHDAALRRRVLDRLSAAGAVVERLRSAIVPSDDSWARDHGPITVLVGDQPRLLDFAFNGWGGKYPASRDDRITSELVRQGVFGDTPCERVELVLEGGSIDSDGRGGLLTTRRCLLSPQRNPGLGPAEIEDALARHLGSQRVLWLAHGALLGDDTDGHIDTLARFCDAQTIAYVHCSDPNDPHAAELGAMHDELAALRTDQGGAYRLIPLPLPTAQYDRHGERLPATYANFLVIDGAVLVPVYGVAEDATALARLADAFPAREIVAIDARPLIEQFGSLHCVTMQLPRGVLP